MTRVVDMADPTRGDEPNEFQGYHHDAGVSFIVVDAPPGSGPRLHRHPYEEVFVVQEGKPRSLPGTRSSRQAAAKSWWWRPACRTSS